MSRKSGGRLTKDEVAELFAMAKAGASAENIRTHFALANFRDARRWVDKIAAGWFPGMKAAARVRPCERCKAEPRIGHRSIGRKCATAEDTLAKARRRADCDGLRTVHLERRIVPPPLFASEAHRLMAEGAGRRVYGRL
jgi:hypothetical protein